MTNTVYDTVYIRCCQTCVIVQENGDTSGLTDAQLEKWERGVYNEDVCSNGWQWSGVQCDSVSDENDTCNCEDECLREGWFSWSWCEFCGDMDGGQRFNVAIMRKVV
jgi:hypothetical protein